MKQLSKCDTFIEKLVIEKWILFSKSETVIEKWNSYWKVIQWKIKQFSKSDTVIEEVKQLSKSDIVIEKWYSYRKVKQLSKSDKIVFSKSDSYR